MKLFTFYDNLMNMRAIRKVSGPAAVRRCYAERGGDLFIVVVVGVT